MTKKHKAKPKADEEPLQPVYMYILMRSDMASLNPGKMAAQATHAANQCVYELRRLVQQSFDDYDQLFDAWEEQRGFGTCIVLDIGSEANLQKFVAASKEAGLLAGVTHDPSYPVRDGQVTHHIPVDTCGFVFGEKEDCQRVLGELPLYQ